jgi:hypothetical protein
VPCCVLKTTLPLGPNNVRARAQKCLNIRVNAAQAELRIRVPDEVTNGDEARFPNYIGNFSKGL